MNSMQNASRAWGCSGRACLVLHGVSGADWTELAEQGMIVPVGLCMSEDFVKIVADKPLQDFDLA